MKFFLAILFNTFFCVSFAQMDFGNGLPITIKVNTSVNLAFGSVEFAGVVRGYGQEPPLVYVEIKDPGGNTDLVSGRADIKTGAYLLKYLCKAPGDYVASAYAVDKRQTAEAKFSVVVSINMQKPIAGLQTEAMNAINALSSYANGALKDIAKPEEIAAAKTKIEKLKKDVGTFGKNIEVLKKSIDVLSTLCSKYPDVNKAAAPYIGKFASEVEHQTDMLKQVTKDLKTSNTPVDDCQKLYLLSESCAAFSTAMNLMAGSVYQIGISIFVDKLWPLIEAKIAPKKFTENEHFGFTQEGKTAFTALQNVDDLRSTSFKAGMAGDITQYVSNTLFKMYCTEYKGIVTGTYGVEGKKDGKMFMKYTLKFEGTASLYCKNTELKKGVPKLNGYMEANVTNMQFTDNVWAVEDHNEWDEVKYERIPFPVVPANASNKDIGFGAVARSVLPGSFYFPLEGKIIQEKMLIKIKPALNDFSALFNNKSLVVVRAKNGAKNLSGGLFEYPIEKAFFIVTRAIRQNDNAPTFSLDIVNSNGNKTLKNEYNRTENPSADTKVDFSFSIKLEENAGTKK